MMLTFQNASGRSELSIEMIDGFVSDEKAYELEMITGNEIPGLLNSYIRHLDEKTYYICDISGMVPLTDYVRRSPLKYEEICLLIRSIAHMKEILREFLLDIEGMLIVPEYIMYDRNRKSIRFCYYPWNNFDVFDSYTKLAEFLLLSIDYSDEDGVKLAYDIYASILNKDYELDKLIQEKNDEREKIEENADIKVDKDDVLTEHKTSGYEDAVDLSLKPLSIICITLLSIMVLGFSFAFLYMRMLVFKMFTNMKIMTGIVFFMCILAYFPIINISDITYKKRMLRHR